MLKVVPLVGTWIEIILQTGERSVTTVVPLVGTWIEIWKVRWVFAGPASFPSWERGLKWIFCIAFWLIRRRSPRGNVD